MVRIRYLEGWEKRETISLWKEAFPEDSEKFLDYYYKEKVKDNKILVAEEEEGGKRRIVSMLQRNPYRLLAGGRVVESDYIIAVATARDRRHQGLMRKLLAWMIEDMWQEGMPFCYLMPADRRIYEPFGFAYIYDQEYWKQREDRNLIAKKISPDQAAAAAEWMSRWIKKRYQVYTIRDEAYVRRLMAELESEQGWMEFLYEADRTSEDRKEEIIGIRCWWGIEKQEQRMCLCEEAYKEQEKKASPAIMARITHLEHCLQMFHLKKDCPVDDMEVILKVEDPFCPHNHGVFLWKLDKHSSKVTRQEETVFEERRDGWKERTVFGEKVPESQKGKQEPYRLKLGIEDLTQWIFGYRDPEGFMAGESDGWHQRIAFWKAVFIDEVV